MHLDLLCQQFIEREKLFVHSDRLLLAVSGGLDSVVLCHLLDKMGYDFEIAHCNFCLRGPESERDETFVRELARQYNRPIHVRRFDTSDYAARQRVSIQVAARELRYNWFLALIGTGAAGSLKYIVTAHHMDDNIETLLMNFFRGTGMAGLHGILPRQENLMRPLLFARKEQLEQYAQAFSLSWVEDSSNDTDKYARNFFRRQVIPLVERTIPGAMENVAANIGRFREAEILYRQAIGSHKEKLLEKKGEEWHIPLLKLKKSNPLETILYEIIREFGFSPGQVQGVISLMDSETGRYLLSGTHRILKNRQWLIISPLQHAGSPHILIEKGQTTVDYGNGSLVIKEIPSQSHRLLTDAAVAQIDADAICYPLCLRKWKPGDYFYPLGMPKKKKVGRFLIDARVSATEKERTWVLEMDRKIIWVVGHRIDDRFKITPRTTLVLKIETRMA